MNTNYEIISKAELLEALRKALKKNSKELPPEDLSIEDYIDNLYNQLRYQTFEFDKVIKFQLPFGSKILHIDRCSLKNRIVEYALAKKIYKINETYWYSMRNKIFRTGSGINEFVRNAKRFYDKYEYFYLIDLKHAFGIDYNKLRKDFLLKNLKQEQVALIDSALFNDNDIDKGLPFGHKLSNILFDCNLVEIELYLTQQNIKFLRLIDSFIFFTNDKEDVKIINKVFEDFEIQINHTKSKFLHREDFTDFDKEILI